MTAKNVGTRFVHERYWRFSFYNKWPSITILLRCKQNAILIIAPWALNKWFFHLGKCLNDVTCTNIFLAYQLGHQSANLLQAPSFSLLIYELYYHYLLCYSQVVVLGKSFPQTICKTIAMDRLAGKKDYVSSLDFSNDCEWRRSISGDIFLCFQLSTWQVEFCCDLKGMCAFWRYVR